jgi:hypothetical protein
MTTATTWLVLGPSFTHADRTLITGIKTKTDFLPSATPGTTNGLFIAGTNAQTTVTDGFGAGTIAAGSFASGAINNTAFNVTETLTANPASGGIVTASFGAGAIDANAIAANAITASEAPNLDAAITTRASAANLTLAMGATFDTATDSLEAIRNRGDAAWGNDPWSTALPGSYGAGTAGFQLGTIYAWLNGAPTFSAAMDAHEYTSARAVKLDNLDMPVSGVRVQTPSLLVSTTVDGAPTSETEFKIADGPTNDDALNGALVIVTKGTQKAVGIVRDYDASEEKVTLVTDLGGFTLADDDQVDVIAGGPVPLWLGASP